MTLPAGMYPRPETRSLRRQTFAKPERVLNDAQQPIVRRPLHAWAPLNFMAPASIVEHRNCAIRLTQIVHRLMPRWAAVVWLLHRACEEWEKQDPARRPKWKKIFERARHRCRVPGCTRLVDLNGHHAEYRSVGGPDTPENIECLCAPHHRMLHDGLLRLKGTGPGHWIWQLGLQKDGTALRTYHGDRLIEDRLVGG